MDWKLWLAKNSRKLLLTTLSITKMQVKGYLVLEPKSLYPLLYVLDPNTICVQSFILQSKHYFKFFKYDFRPRKAVLAFFKPLYLIT